jgi:hypothetical protein
MLSEAVGDRKVVSSALFHIWRSTWRIHPSERRHENYRKLPELTLMCAARCLDVNRLH